jgi:hypothetical protein
MEVLWQLERPRIRRRQLAGGLLLLGAALVVAAMAVFHAVWISGDKQWQVMLFLGALGATFILGMHGFTRLQDLRERGHSWHRGLYIMGLPRRPKPHPNLRRLQQLERRQYDRYRQPLPAFTWAAARDRRLQVFDTTIRIYCMGQYRIAVWWRSPEDHYVWHWWRVR